MRAATSRSNMRWRKASSTGCRRWRAEMVAPQGRGDRRDAEHHGAACGEGSDAGHSDRVLDRRRSGQARARRSLNRPGGNVTGVTFLVNTLAAKRLELLHELRAGAKTMRPAGQSEESGGASRRPPTCRPRRARSACSFWSRTPAASRTSTRRSRNSSSKRVGAVTFAADAVYNARRAQLIALAAQHKLPTMYFYRAFAEAGGLMQLRRLRHRRLSTGRRLCRPHPQGRKARRSAGAAVDQGRAGHQPQDRQGAGHRPCR